MEEVMMEGMERGNEWGRAIEWGTRECPIMGGSPRGGRCGGGPRSI